MIPRSGTPLANEALMGLEKAMEQKLTLGDDIDTIVPQFNRPLFRSAKVCHFRVEARLPRWTFWSTTWIRLCTRSCLQRSATSRRLMSDVREHSVRLSRIGKPCEREMWMAY